MIISDEANKTLDTIIEQRRTVRIFKPDIPKKETIEAIINAGMWAPYAALATTDEHAFRRFFVIQGGSPTLSKIGELIQQQAKVSLEEMDRAINEKPFLREKSIGFMNRLSSLAAKGFPDLLNAPCLIVIAERKGIPSAERQSLAHVIQNMWLKATALGLGMRLVSAIESLTENAALCGLLGLSVNEFAFNGCIFGLSAREPNVGKRPSCHDVTKWM
jgi:nitroreductase